MGLGEVVQQRGEEVEMSVLGDSQSAEASGSGTTTEETDLLA